VAHVLVIHHDSSIRDNLTGLVKVRHEAEPARDVVLGVKQMARRRPDVIVIGHDKEKQEGLRLLKFLRDNQVKIPVIVVYSRGCGEHQPTAMKLGARAYLEYPVDAARLDAAITSALAAKASANAGPPPLTAEEANANLSMLESQLNRKMKCFAGRNQVYLQSVIGRVGRPRIALKCNLRANYGMSKDVYYEWIRDICCGDPTQCEAYRQFQAERESA